MTERHSSTYVCIFWFLQNLLISIHWSHFILEYFISSLTFAMTVTVNQLRDHSKGLFILIFHRGEWTLWTLVRTRDSFIVFGMFLWSGWVKGLFVFVMCSWIIVVFSQLIFNSPFLFFFFFFKHQKSKNYSQQRFFFRCRFRCIPFWEMDNPLLWS